MNCVLRPIAARVLFMFLHSNFRRAWKLLIYPLIGAAGMVLLMLPAALRLRESTYRRSSLDGVVNMRDAVLACRQTGLQGWELVAFAQRLVARKFATYSTLNLWDPPGRAFIYGTGYCTQYNLALKRILTRLGFEVETVFALKARFFDNEGWDMGHTWLRVTAGGETRDVCAGRIENEPGKVHFVPVNRVHNGRAPTMFLTHIGLTFFMGFLEWKALLSGAQPPAWAYEERNHPKE
jgi:hypothetical protein